MERVHRNGQRGRPLRRTLAATDVKVTRGLCRQEYGQIEFDVMDPSGYVLVFAQPMTKNV
jgi:hypothetical protein